MTSQRRREARRVFMEVAELPAEDRGAALAAACAGDKTLRAEVDALLQAEARAGGFLADPTGDVTGAHDGVATMAAATHEKVGEQVGRYKLLEQIGEGGFGSVWAAEQREPVKRRVALKIVKLGMDTKQVIARFEAERQALAMMDHPNIAKVLDAGATETGRPFFVMELVKGVPILEYCDTAKLDTKARLDLFVKVCHAIQHAHQKGIIHRDIKPTNVLVTMHDGVPVPKVIDFGIAKATNAELTSQTVYTQHRQMIGTPAYMSPEQAEMSGLDIDTRSDIYSLGVLLYELLTGTTPFDNKSLLEAGFAEMMRIIREAEPHKPSTRLSTLGQTATRTAEQRRVDVQRLSLLLRGDLDWIVMKCLEKDRTRRYETANGLAADINRHLLDEPVLAGPPSTRYRLRKFVKRNRGQVVAGGVVAAALVVAVIGTSLGMAWAIREKERADREATNASLSAASEREAKLDAQANERKAKDEAARAERELARATEIKRLVTEMLLRVSPDEAQGADPTLLRGILDDAAARLASGEVTDELVAAELHHLVGDVYRRLGNYPQAEAHLSQAVEIRERLLGSEDPSTLNSSNSLAVLFWDQGRLSDAEPLYLRTLETRRRVLGAEHPDTLGSGNNLALVYWSQGRLAEAAALLTEILGIQRRVLGEEHPHTLTSMHNLAILQEVQGRLDEAERLNVETLEIRRRVLGEDHPDTLRTLMNLSTLLAGEGRDAEAEPLMLEALERVDRVMGGEHPNTLNCMHNLATLYRTQGRTDERVAILEKCLPALRRVLGTRNQMTALATEELAVAYDQLGRHDDALPLWRELLAEETSGAESPDATAATLDKTASHLLEHEIEELRDPRRALGYAERACSIEADAGGAMLWQYLDTLALAQHMSGDTAAAVETERRAISLMPEGADRTTHDRLAEYEAALSGGDGGR
ncbi:MAG: serine/threonine protein kinase [Phycisphaerales bacterium]|nr:serine/threonine protein kinase [Phycisphaerales bacterium]